MKRENLPISRSALMLQVADAGPALFAAKL
jgi:hypothetical protein